MARNEEKQLARLNRLYLQQQKEEELKKRPPRPKLATLNTVEDIKKWLPTVVRDIDFYVKQMEVTCYPQHQIEEFELRIDRLRGEYKAFIRKLHQLEPDLKTTPWCDRPYAGKRRKTEAYTCSESKDDTRQKDSNNLTTFVPLCVPVLKNSSLCQNWYGFEKPKLPYVPELESQLQNEPLQFEFENKLSECRQLETSVGAVKWPDNNSRLSMDECNSQGIGAFEKCSESAVNSVECCNRKVDVSGELTEAGTSTLLHHNTSRSRNLEKCRLPTTHLHTKTEKERITGQRTCDYNVPIKKVCVEDSCASSLGNNSGISVLGSLNIPYTDSSSSSETET
ncbi:unnamed protein product [Candidula unifasciata]|uniref:Uncharacterized protein n=1 Tax=Candidula unifasciata TaxID=100452 RepID=A0A8S3ZNA5_9EUPU|nr:unnamed protein product [Candidula unifasciata]